MAEEAGKGAPSLEPPRLWRKKKPAEETSAGEHGRHASTEPDTAPIAEPPLVDSLTTTPAPMPTPTTEPHLPPATEPVEAPETAAAEATPAAASYAEPMPVTAPTSAPTRVETPWIPAGKPRKPARTPASRPSRAPKAPKESRATHTPTPPRATKEPRAPKAPRPPKAPRAPRQRIELPPLNPHVAAAVTGLLVGAWLVLSTFTTLRMCESVRGASACGGPGMLLLVVIVTGGIALGASLLRYFKIRSAGSMSFLAVALVAVLVMVFFAGSLDQWWTIPVVALLTVGAYSLSHWMTTTYIDPED